MSMRRRLRSPKRLPAVYENPVSPTTQLLLLAGAVVAIAGGGYLIINEVLKKPETKDPLPNFANYGPFGPGTYTA
jgi:hypothetical protein